MNLSKKTSSTKDLTTGAISMPLILFALPLLGSSLIQQLYNTVDLIFVGNLLGKEASAAVGASSLLITCLLGFFTGLSVGAGIVIAQIFGNPSPDKISKAVHTALTLAFAGGALLTMLGCLGTPLFLLWMNTPVEIIAASTSYIRIYFLSMTAIITYNMGAGILRAVGDSQTPMICQLIGGVANVILDAVFLLVFHWGIEGVAWATCISQFAAAALVLLQLSHTKGDHRLSWNLLCLHKPVMLRILRIGVPVGIQSMLITLSNLFVQYRINGLGINAIAAFTAYFKVELLIYLPIVAFGQAMTTFAAQNIGAGRLDRTKKGTRVCLLTAGLFTILASAAMLAAGSYAFSLFNQDQAVIALGLRIIKITFPFYFLYVLLEVLGATVRGAGNAAAPMAVVLLNICALRTALLFTFPFFYSDVQGVATAYPITWFTTSVCMALLYRRTLF